MEPKIHTHHHHILPAPVALTIGAILLVLTGLTVWIAGVDLGQLNFVIAMAVATSKALLVAMFFMNLKYDRRENGMIFLTSFLFLAIFIVLTGTDEFFRGDVEVKGPLIAATQTKSKVKKPWIVTPDLIAHGKEVFAIQCVSCHGDEGKGNGPAAAALNPPPRNFTSPDGWKNGRKPTQVFKTLKEGIPNSGMASFVSLPPDDRWALVHFVLSLDSPPPADTPTDFAAIGLDPNKETVEAKEEPTIPLRFAMERMAVPEIPIQSPAVTRIETIPSKPGAQTYVARCAKCHGLEGEGGIHIENLGVFPTSPVVTARFSKRSESLTSLEKFNHLVIYGIPGNLMPGNGDLSKDELGELYQYVNNLAISP